VKDNHYELFLGVDEAAVTDEATVLVVIELDGGVASVAVQVATQLAGLASHRKKS
jgi:hypothetical protein